MSLRLRLLLLVLLVLLPAAGLLVYTAAEQRRAAIADAQDSAVRLAAFASNNQQQLIDTTRQLLAALAVVPDVRSGDGAACGAVVSSLLKQHPRYSSIGAATRDGDVFCSAVALREPMNVAGRGYFWRAVVLRDFAVGEYMIGRITGKPILVFAYPALDEAGRVLAVVLAGLDLTWLGQVVAEARMPEASTVTILDRSGLVLARYPPAGEEIGRPVNPSLLKLVLGTRGVRTAEAPGPDGTPYLYAFSALSYRDAPVAYVSVGVSKAVAFDEPDRLLRLNLLILGIVAALTLGMAWIGGKLGILEPVRALVDATRRLSTGDLSARSGRGHGQGELGQLARAFDLMAESLQEAERRRLMDEELRRKNYELEQQNAAIEEANRMKTEFVSMVSHELRTPLTSIQGYVELLQERDAAALGAEACQSLAIVKQNAGRLLGLINDLLDLSRMEAGKIDLRCGPVDLPAVIEAVAASIRLLIESKRQRLTVAVDEALPVVCADADRVAQILTNLLANAHKYTPVEGTIEVAARRQNGFVRVDVSDSGIGLSAEEQAQLFTRFFRAQQRGPLGTGLGLVITRLLVELQGGRITVSSAPGRGSTFSFSLPVLAPTLPVGERAG